MKFKVLLITQIYIIICLISGYIYEIMYIYLSLFIHELGHILTVLLFKKKITMLEISPLGGILTVDNCQNDRNYKELLIYASGPFASLLFFIVLKWVGANELLINSSLYVLLLNLLPILPLDGARIIMSFKQYLFPYRKVLKIVTIGSILVSISLILYFIKNYNYVIILMFFLYKNLLSYNNISYDYYDFLYYKLFNPNESLKSKMLTSVKQVYSAFYKGFNNVFFIDHQFITEKEVLNQLINKKNVDNKE